ncbi:MAG: acetylornithine deacetylase, partial [Rhodospirillaceae bacterium]|nr:acetylornithine deacetylase [Rhodospirillaceae bacterium]
MTNSSQSPKDIDHQPQKASIEMIRTLVAFDTTSCKSNLALIEFIKAYLSDLGIKADLIFDESRQKANLFATIGPAGQPGIVLSGHTDVVPVDGQDWDNDPFNALEKDNRLYGRGTADMKSFIAVVLAALPRLLNLDLKAPLHLAFSYDEEVGCIGVRHLLDQIRGMKIKPYACIVGEPTEMRVITGHKGKKSLSCHVRGRECHSALAPSGVNAVEAAAQVIAFLHSMTQRFQREGPFDPAFEPPHSTVHTGLVSGGTALNIVPRDCTFDFEIRSLPSHDAEAIQDEINTYAEAQVLPAMQAIAKETGFSFSENSGFPGLDTDPEAQVTHLAKTLSGANTTGKV